jgi:carboxylesterase
MFPTELFQEPQHQPFILNSPQPQDKAALLIHGFPGTPDEMRPISNTLHDAGWTVHSILLPGLGPEINQLFSVTHQDWINAVRIAAVNLLKTYPTVLIGGFSMGAALALIAAAELSPQRTLLLAPYWRVPGYIWGLIPALTRMFPRIKPFSIAPLDFSKPDTIRGMEQFMPGIDLSDPQVQEGIRNFTLPTSLFREIHTLGRHAAMAARELISPTLIIQGRQDPLVTPQLTHKLIRKMPNLPKYIEVDAEHNLPDPTKPAWLSINQAVLDFSHSPNGKV